MEPGRAAVSDWVLAQPSDFRSPVHVHFDELIADYTPTRAVLIAEEVLVEAVRALGPRLADIKPVVSLPLRDTRRLVRRPPEIAKSVSALDRWTTPSLTLVSRAAYGRVAMLMENYEIALRLDEQPPGVVVWFYRCWHPDADEWVRSITAEHWLEVGPGQELPRHG